MCMDLTPHKPICMSAKLKKLSTSREDVFLLSEMKTCGQGINENSMKSHKNKKQTPKKIK